MGPPLKVTLRCAQNFDMRYVPRPAAKLMDWWAKDPKMHEHAKYCLPLLMANSLGYVIPSPGTFEVSWDGGLRDAKVVVREIAAHAQVDSDSAPGGFTVQPGFIPSTQGPGDFIYVKGIPNQRSPFSCMEALIEAWWNPSRFGLVFLVNAASSFVVHAGMPLAQMFVYQGQAGTAEFQVRLGYPPEQEEWEKRRFRIGYRRDLDYMQGKHPNGESEPSHIVSWEQLRLRQRRGISR